MDIIASIARYSNKINAMQKSIFYREILVKIEYEVKIKKYNE